MNTTSPKCEKCGTPLLEGEYQRELTLEEGAALLKNFNCWRCKIAYVYFVMDGEDSHLFEIAPLQSEEDALE